MYGCMEYILDGRTVSMIECMDNMVGWSAYFDVKNFLPQGRDCILRILVQCDKTERLLSVPQYPLKDGSQTVNSIFSTFYCLMTLFDNNSI